MKTLNDIQEAHKNWEHDDISDENGIRALFEQVVGITELLESKACPSNISWKCRFVDPNSGPSDADIEARKTKKDDERRVAIKAQPTRIEYVGTYAPQTVEELRAAWEVLEAEFCAAGTMKAADARSVAWAALEEARKPKNITTTT